MLSDLTNTSEGSQYQRQSECTVVTWAPILKDILVPNQLKSVGVRWLHSFVLSSLLSPLNHSVSLWPEIMLSAQERSCLGRSFQSPHS